MSEKSIFLVGDSIAAWNPSTEFENKGIPGSTTLDLLNFLSRTDFDEHDTVIINIGVNDVLSGFSYEFTTSNYFKIVRLLQKYFKRVICTSLTPVDSLIMNKKIVELNKYVKNLPDIVFLNVYDSLLENDLLALKYTTDGLHLNRYGYEVLNGLIDKVTG